MLEKQINRSKRRMSIRKKISGTESRPRASVYRSNKYISCQIIDDVVKATIVGGSDKKFKGTKTESSKLLGLELAKLALEKNVTKIVFDRGGYKFHGRVAALAEGLREGGLQF